MVSMARLYFLDGYPPIWVTKHSYGNEPEGDPDDSTMIIHSGNSKVYFFAFSTLKPIHVSAPNVNENFSFELKLKKDTMPPIAFGPIYFK